MIYLRQSHPWRSSNLGIQLLHRLAPQSPSGFAVLLAICLNPTAQSAELTAQPNVVLILADDLGYSDLGCYGSEIPTPNLDRLAANGLRFSQFYNGARCCPTRASLLTGLYPHQAGVGHMLGDWKPPSYSSGLGPNAITLAEALRLAGYRTYHAGKWHVGGVGGKPKAGVLPNHPLDRGFDRTYGTGGGGNFFAPSPLYLDRDSVKPGDDYYTTDAFTDYSARFLAEHGRDHKDKPFFLHVCYTSPHFPLHARPEDIAKHKGKYRIGWDALREKRFAKQKELGIVPRDAKLSPRDPEARAWADVPETERDEWDQRMAVHAAMIDRMDQGIGRILEEVRKLGAAENTLVMFLSDNGASAEFLDSWPNPARGHKPGSAIGSKDSHKCLEIGWANAANTPFRENKMWIHEGGISTPFIANWPAGIKARGSISPAVSHIIDVMPTLLDIAGGKYPEKFGERALTPLEGRSLTPAFRGDGMPERTLAWEHEGNRGIRSGNWKLVASFKGPWELYDLAADRTETRNLAEVQQVRVKALADEWQQWADRVGVVPWEQLPGAKYAPSDSYRKKSEKK